MDRIARNFALALTVLLAAAMVMRGPVTCVGPVADAIVETFAITYSQYGFLTAVPIAAFGIFSFFAISLTERLGLKTAAGLALAVLVAGAAGRMINDWNWLLASTVAVGAGIALLNVIMPVICKAWFGTKTAFVMGIYTGVIGLSGAVGGLTSVPASNLGWGVSGTMALWALLAAAALVLWFIGAQSDTPQAHAKGSSERHFFTLLKSPTAVAVVFVMGLQSLLIYTVAAWLPSYLTEVEGVAREVSGFWLFVYLVSGLPASMLTPWFMRRVGNEFAAEVILCAAYLLGIAGWLIDPVWLIPSCIAAGASQGSMLSVAFLLMAQKSADTREMLKLSALSQGVGYILAGLGPLAFGLILEACGMQWLPSMTMVAVVVVLWGLAGWFASRSKHL